MRKSDERFARIETELAAYSRDLNPIFFLIP